MMKSLRQIFVIFAIGLLNGANGQGSEREAVEFGKQFAIGHLVKYYWALPSNFNNFLNLKLHIPFW